LMTLSHVTTMIVKLAFTQETFHFSISRPNFGPLITSL
jgi:hypothetical protein